MQTIEQHLNARETRRLASEHRALIRAEKLEATAERMIGELCKNGATMYYCWPNGGRYFESTSHTAVVDYLMRNKFVNIF